jgi:hypothetical protein
VPAVEIVTVRPLTVAATDVSGWELLDGDVGLPPQPATPPRASNPAALLQHAQNSRRVWFEESSSLITLSPHQVRKTALVQCSAKTMTTQLEPSCHP